MPETPNEVTFTSEQEKARAIAEYDEQKGKADDLDRLMNAKIVAAPDPATKADDTPPQATQKEAAPQQAAGADATAAGKADTTPPQSGTIIDANQWAKDRGYASFAEARKAFDEQRETISRQERFIKDRLQNTPTTPNQGYDDLVKKNRELEERLNTVQKPAAAASTEQKVEAQKDKIGLIRQALANNLQKRKELTLQRKADPALGMDAEFLSRMNEVEDEKFNLDMQMVDEMSGLRSLLDNTTKQMQDFNTTREADMRREQTQKLYEQEMDEITEFAFHKAHPEFAFSENKDSREVEAEYVKWANMVASAQNGTPIDMLRSPQEKQAVQYAMSLLTAKDPELINALKAAGVPIEPSPDVQKYLDICELLDHRDGLKKNPLTGAKEQQFRLVRDNATGQLRQDPIRFASLEDAYQHKCAIDGTYMQRVKDAYVKGSKDHADAAAKRAAAPVELDNASGASKQDVGLGMTPQKAMEILNTIDEAEAYRRKVAGDPTMYNQYEEAMGVISAVKTA